MVKSKQSDDVSMSSMDALYVHYSPPRVVEARRWARGGDIDRLQQAALGGHGHRLLGLAAPGPKARAFLRELPSLMNRCDGLHSAVSEGSLSGVKAILEGDPMRRKLAMCRDRAGVGLLHKAVYYDYQDIVDYLLEKYPQTVHMRDSEGRTPLHYAAVCSDPAGVTARLIRAGAERTPPDVRQKTPAYYIARPMTLRLPEPTPPTPQQELVIKPANIRIWCHDRDLGRLQQVVWRGQGARLRTEVSSQPAVKKFLEAVPHIMGTIKEMHTAAIENDVGKLKALTADPVPAIIFSSKDVNGLTALHKAAGLGHHEVAEHILERFPEVVTAVDTDGRTPLHWSALNKDDDKMYNLMLQNGAEEGKLDNKLKSAGYYKNRPMDIDKSLMQVIPEAPRIASATYPSSWDWELLKTDNQVLTLHNRQKKNSNASPLISPTAPTNLPINIPAPKAIAEEVLQRSLRQSPEPMSPGSDLTHEVLSNNNIDNLQYAHENYFDKDKLSENEYEDPDTHLEELPTKTDHHELEDEENANYAEIEKHKEISNNNSPTVKNDRNILSPENEIDGTHDMTPPKSPELHKSITRSRTRTPGSAQSHRTIVGRTPSRGQGEDVTSDFDDDNIDPEIQNTLYDDEESDDDKHKRPEVQDIDDEKGDEPDAERLHTGHRNSMSRQSMNDLDDDDVHVRGESPSEYGDSHKADTADVLDVENLKNKLSAKGRMSQGSESTIEGVVNADPEVDSLEADQREKGNSPVENGGNNEDEEVQTLIDTGNMEQLAALVLNGEGERLVGQMSSNPELQAFLDNVPSYMNKIKRVHLSAREGELRELQAALDRRKFATARDRISPNGATPLHVATLFGKTPVVRYLAGRFPETLSAVDFDGRTALHYAAVLKDNGHYYNILQSIGANPKDQDENGHTPEDYLADDKYLSHKQLLKDFGAEESMADEMLNDKETSPNNGQTGQVDIPIFRTEEGRYLASSLGDPLIKGLTEVANTRPKDPIAFLATYLYNFANQNKSRVKTQESSALIGDDGISPIETPHAETPATSTAHDGLGTFAGTAAGAATATAGVAMQQASMHRTLPPTPPAPATPGAPEAAFSSDNRDEHGQSMLHFAAARAHARGALIQLVRESGVSPAFRDELYRTARDVSLQANLAENTKELDRWLLETAARGETEKLTELAMEGYDHILDVVDDDGVPVAEVVGQRGQKDVTALLDAIPDFEETRERFHQYIREGDADQTRLMLERQVSPNATPSEKLFAGRNMAAAKNAFGRCSLHIAVLAQQEDIAEFIARTFPETLRIGDNLERTALHYAMGVDNVESTSRILIKAGAKRVLKDLKGRQPSYYFMNKSEILRLKEEEDEY